MAPNVPEYAVAFHGTVSAGGAVTSVNPTYGAEETAFQLDDAGAQLLVTVAPVPRHCAWRLRRRPTCVAST